MGAQYRQGDVLLEKVAGFTSKAVRITPSDRIVLAFGEQTGHAHAISVLAADLYQAPDGTRFVAARDHAVLVHEEHDAIRIPPGIYKVIQQRRWVQRPYPENESNESYWDPAMD